MAQRDPRQGRQPFPGVEFDGEAVRSRALAQRDYARQMLEWSRRRDEWGGRADKIGALWLETLSRVDYAPSAGDARIVLCDALAAALEITGARMGNIQLVNPTTGALEIAVQHGFSPEFLAFFGQVDHERAACGMALRRGERVVVEDVTESPIFFGTPALEVMLDAGARAVMSTPLIDTEGHVVGMVSTHFGVPWRPTERELRRIDLLARLVGRLLPWNRGESTPPRAVRGRLASAG